MDWTKIKYFIKEEFECPCCGECHMDMGFMLRLDRARYTAGVPFIINSGYRCEKHNMEVPGASETSSHPKGLAVDIKCTDSGIRYNMRQALIAEGFTRMGTRKDFIHVDDDRSKPQRKDWVY